MLVSCLSSAAERATFVFITNKTTGWAPGVGAGAAAQSSEAAPEAVSGGCVSASLSPCLCLEEAEGPGGTLRTPSLPRRAAQAFAPVRPARHGCVPSRGWEDALSPRRESPGREWAFQSWGAGEGTMPYFQYLIYFSNWTSSRGPFWAQLPL
ncbi:uncharacterized protein [Symphalangus syndactylus]|uniref:uncharacterized protein isoform X1 n=1 Tax=Symphalangus syndactylus TaxID=9590 RepID=UPI003006798C